MSSLSLATANYMSVLMFHGRLSVVQPFPGHMWVITILRLHRNKDYAKSIVSQHPHRFIQNWLPESSTAAFLAEGRCATLLLPHTHRCPGRRGNHKNPDVCFTPFWLLSLPEALAHLPGAKSTQALAVLGAGSKVLFLWSFADVELLSLKLPLALSCPGHVIWESQVCCVCVCLWVLGSFRPKSSLHLNVPSTRKTPRISLAHQPWNLTCLLWVSLVPMTLYSIFMTDVLIFMYTNTHICCVSYSLCYDKNTNIWHKLFKRGIYFNSWSPRFSLAPLALGPWWSRTVWSKENVAKAAYIVVVKQQRSGNAEYILHSVHFVTGLYIFFYHLPITWSCYEPTKELIHRLGRPIWSSHFLKGWWYLFVL